MMEIMGVKGKVIPLEIRKKILYDRENGQTLKSISDCYGYSISGISRFLNRYKETGKVEPLRVARPRSEQIPRRIITDDIRRQILMDYHSGLTWREITDKSGFSKAAVEKLLSACIKSGQIKRRRVKIPDKMRKKIAKDRLRGLLRREIAAKYDVTIPIVDYCIRQYERKVKNVSRSSR